jgi:hypothetical protein
VYFLLSAVVGSQMFSLPTGELLGVREKNGLTGCGAATTSALESHDGALA